MTEVDQGRRRRRDNALLDSAEELATGVGRFGYSLLSLGLDLLPRESRGHMHAAVRELSYAFADLPRAFADVAGEAIEAWAEETDEPAAPAARNVAAAPASHEPAPVQRVRIYEAPAEPAAAASSFAVVAEPEPLAAPTTAITAGVTIAHIEYDPPGRDLDGEYVLIRNGSAEGVDLTGWSLRDGNARHVFLFPAFTLAPGAEVRVWTRTGAPDAGNLFWGQLGAVWNNDGDTGTLKDAAGAVVSRFTYAGSR